MDISISIDLELIAKGVQLPLHQVQSAVALLDDGNTIPFITRYRKDQTGGLDEEQIREIQRQVEQLRTLEDRKQKILKSIETQGRLTDELTAQIQAAKSSKWLEDLYLPFKPKKQTLATKARERGLEPLAVEVLNATCSKQDMDRRAQDFVDPAKALASADDVWEGVGHLLAELFGDRADVRNSLRRIFRRTGKLVSTRIQTATQPAKQIHANASDAKPDFPAEGTENATATVATTPVAESDAAETDVGGEGTEQSTTVSAAAQATLNSPVTGEPPAQEPAVSVENGAQDSPPTVPEVSQKTSEVMGKGQVVPESKQTRPFSMRERRKEKKDKKRKKLEAAFKDYFKYSEPLQRIPPHRMLAINRGERAGMLRVRIEADHVAMLEESEKMVVDPEHPHAEYLSRCMRDSLTRLILPSLEREARRELTDQAEIHAIQVFIRNLRNLLLQPPVVGRRVLAIDPGFRSGCKLAALDEFGGIIGHGLVHIVGKSERLKNARDQIVKIVTEHNLSAIAIGNGTACRETENLVAEIIAKELPGHEVEYTVVNEAGASVYSTSPLGREEMGELDATQRSAVSIGRRLLDPLSELVKINPANIGVGLYQHDIKAKHLRNSLDAVVESCVNLVGVDVNAASPALLSHVSGLNKLTARRIYDYRREHGPFKNRESFKQVTGFGESAFIQAAGFLKIVIGDNPLDATWIHPENYEEARKILERLGSNVEELANWLSPLRGAGPEQAATNNEEPVSENSEIAPRVSPASIEGTAASENPTQSDSPAPEETVAQLSHHSRIEQIEKRAAQLAIKELSAELEIGELTLQDILRSLIRPQRDPREDLPPPIFRRGIVKLDDLQPGLELSGTVLNVVDFGVFVDIGLHDSGLIHVSQLTNHYIKDPHDVVSVGDIVKVWVVEVDKQRRRVSLSAIQPGTEKPSPARPKRSSEKVKQRPKPPPRKHHRKPEGRQVQRRKSSNRPPKPAVPITKAMELGNDPMRTFGDLIQYYEKKLQTKPDSDQSDKSAD